MRRHHHGAVQDIERARAHVLRIGPCGIRRWPASCRGSSPGARRPRPSAPGPIRYRCGGRSCRQITLGKSFTKRFAASAEGKVNITCVAQSSSGLFIGEGFSPRLPSGAMPSGSRCFSARIARDHLVEPVELDVQHRAHQLGGARAVAGERLLPVVAAVPVEVAGSIAQRARSATASSLTATPPPSPRGHVLVVVEAERADMADRAEFPALVAAADALAGVLDDDEVVARWRSP